ncbi:unnamed protein product [Ectocarpus sp. CCAP 1310/34]|nr:unnamed protein product [Ectocarpus sp. CCAP 1310/34]
MDTSSTSPLLPEAHGYSSLSSSAAQAVLLAEMFTLKCETGILVVGLQDGEALWTPVRILCTLVTVSVASAWISRRKSIKKLLIFFSHWLRTGGLDPLLRFLPEAARLPTRPPGRPDT